jgi:hypothetical protein
MPICQGNEAVYFGGFFVKSSNGCTGRTKHKGDAYCPRCNLRLARAGKPVRGSVITRKEWDRTWVTDAERVVGDTRLWSRYTYDEMVPLHGGTIRHDTGRDDCARCEATIEGTLSEEAEREEGSRRAAQAFMSRKDISG